MSAGLEINDWMFSARGIRPWHGIGEVIQEAPTSDEAIKIAKLDWKVVQAHQTKQKSAKFLWLKSEKSQKQKCLI